MGSHDDAGVLPKRKDADPRWRRTAKFEVWEIEAVLGASLELLPIDRLVFYCVMLLSGSRVGEVCGLRVRDYDRNARPLPRLHITDQGEDAQGNTEAGGCCVDLAVTCTTSSRWTWSGSGCRGARITTPDEASSRYARSSSATNGS
jgi:hypothetical protein